MSGSSIGTRRLKFKFLPEIVDVTDMPSRNFRILMFLSLVAATIAVGMFGGVTQQTPDDPAQAPESSGSKYESQVQPRVRATITDCSTSPQKPELLLSWSLEGSGVTTHFDDKGMHYEIDGETVEFDVTARSKEKKSQSWSTLVDEVMANNWVTVDRNDAASANVGIRFVEFEVNLNQETSGDELQVIPSGLVSDVVDGLPLSDRMCTDVFGSDAPDNEDSGTRRRP